MDSLLRAMGLKKYNYSKQNCCSPKASFVFNLPY